MSEENMELTETEIKNNLRKLKKMEDEIKSQSEKLLKQELDVRKKLNLPVDDTAFASMIEATSQLYNLYVIQVGNDNKYLEFVQKIFEAKQMITTVIASEINPE
jgi:hypothetical protein